jgi:hypothetical protein
MGTVSLKPEDRYSTLGELSLGLLCTKSYFIEKEGERAVTATGLRVRASDQCALTH